MAQTNKAKRVGKERRELYQRQRQAPASSGARSAEIERSERERKAQEEERRIARELRLQRRIGDLTRQLSRATFSTQARVFSLGRELVTDQGWAVVRPSAVEVLQMELEQLRATNVELQASLGRVENDLYEVRKSNADLREELRVATEQLDASVNA